MFHWHQVWSLMRELTQCDIEKRAIMRLINHVEPMIDELILQSKKELDKKNNLRRIQGLSDKKRIDEECILNAIKTLNSKNIQPSRNNGGEKKLKHPNKNLEQIKNNMEVS